MKTIKELEAEYEKIALDPFKAGQISTLKDVLKLIDEIFLVNSFYNSYKKKVEELKSRIKG